MESMVHAVAECQADVRVCNTTRAYDEVRVLMPETTGHSMICAPADRKGQGGYFCHGLMTADSQLRKRGIEGFCGKSLPQKGNSLDKPRQKAME